MCNDCAQTWEYVPPMVGVVAAFLKGIGINCFAANANDFVMGANQLWFMRELITPLR